MSPRTLAASLMFALAAFGQASAQHLAAADRATLVAELWSTARTSATTWPRVRADWDSALAHALDAAERPQSDTHFVQELQTLVALLNDGQGDVVPPSSLRTRLARPPLVLESVERRPFLLDYVENDEMRVARPERLSEILAVQGVAAEDWIRDSVLPRVGGATPAARWDRAVRRMLEGDKGTAVHLLLRPPTGERRGVSVTRSISLAERWPAEPPAVTIDSLPDGVVVVRVHSLSDADVVQRFDRAFPTFAGVRGLIVDVRGVAGGRLEYAYAVLTRLASAPLPAPQRALPVFRPAFRLLTHPESVSTWYRLPPDTIWPRSDHPAYLGPVAVLSGPTTAGAAEDLLAAVRGARRGVIVGSTSAGSPGETLILPLPANWGVELTAVDDALPDGTPFAGIGIVPDVSVEESVDALLTGRDAVLERAREYLVTGAN